METTAPGAFVMIRYGGYNHKFRKAPQESDERAFDRAWFIVKQLPAEMPLIEKESRSHIWANVKYFAMKYRCTTDESN